MSKENFDLKQKEIAAISDQDVKLPNMPVGEAVQEAEDLAAWCVDIAVRLSCYHVDIQNNRLYVCWYNPPCVGLCVIAEGGKGDDHKSSN